MFRFVFGVSFLDAKDSNAESEKRKGEEEEKVKVPLEFFAVAFGSRLSPPWARSSAGERRRRSGDDAPYRRRVGKLYRARSRLYRSQILQVNLRWKALAEIYTMHSFAVCTVL